MNPLMRWGYILVTILSWVGWQRMALAEDASMVTAARVAVVGEPSEAKAAIALLRGRGPEGLAVIMKEFGAQIARAREGKLTRRDEPWAKVADAIDAVARQRDAWASGLYWYTDLEEAKAAARREGKPILSLRLLGNLDEELSCANSRFFRTVLYADANVSTLLQEQFILHWKSVRPVPTVTIDFGDGRLLKRTVTGNSIHYVLDADGGPIDALPGLYGATEFARQLKATREFFGEYSKLQTKAERAASLVKHHRQAEAEAAQAWAADVAEVGGIGPLLPEAGASGTPEIPTAAQAAPIAVSKATFEAGVVEAVAAAPNPAAAGEEIWARVAALHASEAKLGAGSVALIRSKAPLASTAAKATISKAKVEDPLLRMMRNFEKSVALDTVRNEYLYRRQIHGWLAQGAAREGVEKLNDRVYAELFLTPRSDPWLGLVSQDAYSAIDADGIQACLP